MPYLLIGTPCFNKYADELASYDFTPLSLPTEHRVNSIVANHADTLVWSDGYTHIANEEVVERMPKELRGRFVKTKETPSGNYPDDTVFNALLINRKLFAKTVRLSATVRDYAAESGFTVVDVKQGYARCSVLSLPGARAAVTADRGMAKVMAENGIDVLTVSPGHIKLDWCEYGFIGGASFTYEPHNCCSLSSHTRYVFFFGDIRKHPDGERIREFIENRGYEVVSLSGELQDFGGAIVVE